MAGVCAGLANHFDVDHIIVRILAVLLAIVTCGLAIVVYVVLWIVLPLEPEHSIPFDVEPELAESRTYGVVQSDEASSRGNARPRDAARPAAVGGHVPPDPPSSSQYIQSPGAAAAAVHAYAASSESMPQDERDATLKLRIGLAVGLVVLFLFAIFALSCIVEGPEFWQFWPTGLMIVGIAMIVLPFRAARPMIWRTMGIVIALIGAVLLPIALGVFSVDIIGLGVRRYWCLLAIALMVYILGSVHESSPMLVVGTFVFALFCLATVRYCAIPGNLSSFVILMPSGGSYVVDVSMGVDRFFGWPIGLF